MKKYFETITVGAIAMTMMVINDMQSIDGEWIMCWIQNFLNTNTEISWNLTGYISLVAALVVYMVVTIVATEIFKNSFNTVKTKVFTTTKEQTKVSWISAD